MSFERLVARQAGVVTLAQAVAAGMSAATVQRRVREGRWTRLHPGVYLVGGHRLTSEARIRAAWLWAAPDAIVTGPAAACWHHMLDQAPAIIDLTVPACTKPRPRPGIRLRRRDLYGSDVTEPTEARARGIRVAAPPFAALETAVDLPDGSTFLDRALQKHVRFPAVYRSFCRNMGRTGSSTAGRLLVAAADRADSAAERLLVRLLREAGIDGWVLGHRLGPYLIDLAFPAQRVAIEVDSWAWHVDPDRFRNDRRKGNYITRRGWDLLRFTWHGLHEQPAESVSEIRQTLTVAA
ncbi:type IV toxin-antitoxin system AbiEi family antitoxin domain-containing protein [Pseudonocardia sp. DLS-67]